MKRTTGYMDINIQVVDKNLNATLNENMVASYAKINTKGRLQSKNVLIHYLLDSHMHDDEIEISD